MLHHNKTPREKHGQNQDPTSNHTDEHISQREDHSEDATTAETYISTSLPTPLQPISLAVPAATVSRSRSTSRHKLRPRPSRSKTDAVRKVLGNWAVGLGHPWHRHSHDDNAHSHGDTAVPDPSPIPAVADTGEERAASLDDDDGARRRADYQITHWPDRPRRRSGGPSLSTAVEQDHHQGRYPTDEEIRQELKHIWRRNASKREPRRRRQSGEEMMEREERREEVSPGEESRGHNQKNDSNDHIQLAPTTYTRPVPPAATTTKSKPRASPTPGSGNDGVPPLVLRTRNLSTSTGAGSGSGNKVNYCYPQGSPRSNRENPFAPQQEEQGDDGGYESDGSASPVSQDAIFIQVYRSKSLAGQDRRSDSGGDGKSARGRKPVGAPPIPPGGVKYPGDTKSGTARSPAAIGPRRTPSTKSKDGQGGRVSKAMAHRRRQTRYAGLLPSAARSSSPTSVYRTSVYYSPANIRQALSTPSLYASWAIGGVGNSGAASWARDREPPTPTPMPPPTPTPPSLDRSASFPEGVGSGSGPGAQRCFMVGCVSGKPVVSGSGLCEDCAEEFRPRESTFLDRTRPPSRAYSFDDVQPMIDDAEFDAMFGPMPTAHLQEELELTPRQEQRRDEQQQQQEQEEEGDGEVDTPADKVASKFNPKFSSRPDVEFRLQPAPKGKATAAASTPASKHDSVRSTGSDKSHVGFQMATSTPSKTPEPGPERRRPNSEQADGYPDNESATSDDAWESRSCSPALSETDSPSLRDSRDKQRSWGSDTGSVASQPDVPPGLIINDGEDGRYDDIDEIIALYQELRKSCVVTSPFPGTVTSANETPKPLEVRKLNITAAHRGPPKSNTAVKRTHGSAKGSGERDAMLRSEVNGRDDGPPIGNWI